MASTTFLQLKQRTIAAINETADTTVADFDPGTGGAVLESTMDAIGRYLNDGAALLARTCLAYRIDDATAAWAANAKTMKLENVANASGAYLWQPLDVQFAGQPLAQTLMSYAPRYLRPSEKHFGALLPRFWYLDSNQSIALAPFPVQAGTLTAEGFAIPPLMVAPTDAPTWMADDEARFLYLYAAVQVVERNVEDDVLRARIPLLQQRWQEVQSMLTARLVRQIGMSAYRAYFAGAASEQSAQQGQGQ